MYFLLRSINKSLKHNHVYINDSDKTIIDELLIGKVNNIIECEFNHKSENKENIRSLSV